MPRGLLTRFFQAMRENGCGVFGGPAIWEQLVKLLVVVMQAQEDLTQVGPRLDPVTLGAGENRE